MKLPSYLIILFSIAIFVDSCGVVGKNLDHQSFDAGKLDKLAIGNTTAADVCAEFGPPTKVVKISNGNAYVYRRSVAKGTAIWLLLVSFGKYDKQYDQMVFFFDNNNILTHHGASFHAHKASYGLPF